MVEDALADAILQSEFKDGDSVKVSCVEKKIAMEKVDAPADATVEPKAEASV
jgi:hypothetical protein